MSTYRTTFSRRPASEQPPAVLGAADFDGLDAASAAGQQWVSEDPVLHSYEIALVVAADGPSERHK